MNAEDLVVKNGYRAEFMYSSEWEPDSYWERYNGKCITALQPEFVRKDLKYIVIPQDVVRVASGVFAGCENLEAVELHCGMEICKGAFAGCPKLKYLIIPGYNPEYCRFIADEYYDMHLEESMELDEIGPYQCIGEAEFRQDERVHEMLKRDDPDVDSEANFVIIGQDIRINYFAFDDLLSMKLCRGLDQTSADT